MPSCPKLNNKDPAYVNYIRDLCHRQEARCFVCGIRDHSLIGHHLRGKRAHGDKHNIIILCHRCHQRIHQMGPSAITKKYGVTREQMKQKAVEMYDEYNEWAPFLVNAP